MLNNIINEGIDQDIIKKISQISFVILNLNARQLRHQFLIDKSQTHIRLNFAPHSYLYPNVRFGEEIKINALTALYTSDEGQIVNSALRGIEECIDFGGITINPQKYYMKKSQQEVHLHLVDESCMAVSPNNGTFLLNLTMPLVNFYIALQALDQNNKQLTIFKQG